MKLQSFYFASIIILIYFILPSIYCEDVEIQINNTLFYEEKYFRLLSNNYEDIEQGITWTTFGEENGIGFQAIKDFGSIVFLKDWSMYNFKLTKIVFRPYCSVKIVGSEVNFDNSECAAEMWLYHTKDNNYFSPARKIFLKQNYFVIIVQFKEIDNDSPLASNLFKNLNLNEFIKTLDLKNGKQISPVKPVKLYQIIQTQPSVLFEGNLNTDQECLFMVFTQFHFISKNDLDNLKCKEKNGKMITSEHPKKIYRNSMNINEINPMATLLAYSGTDYFKCYSIYLIFSLLLLL